MYELLYRSFNRLIYCMNCNRLNNRLLHLVSTHATDATFHAAKPVTHAIVHCSLPANDPILKEQNESS